MVELRRCAFAASVLAFAASMFAPRQAHAQLHWDASVQVGAMKRLLVERPPGGGDAGFGPTGQVTAHVALLPLVHVGGYLAHDISPLPGDAAARNITSGGVRAKAGLPFGSKWRAWGFVGFGYAGVYSQSYDSRLSIASGDGSTATRDVHVHGAGGSFFDLPFGIGASYKLRKPWALSAELGARAGFGHTGSVYEDPGPQVRVTGSPNQNAVPAGLDRFAVGLTVGVMVDL